MVLTNFTLAAIAVLLSILSKSASNFFNSASLVAFSFFSFSILAFKSLIVAAPSFLLLLQDVTVTTLKNKIAIVTLFLITVILNFWLAYNFPVAFK